MQDGQPLITVITATFNAAKTIPTLYSSLCQQDFCEFEWVVIDGASNDGTVALLQRLSEEKPWIRFLSEPDFGVYHAINKGLALARGTYYVVAGADDRFFPSAISGYAAVLGQSSVDVVLARVVKDGKVVGGFYPRRAWIGTARMFAGSHSIGMLIRRDLHEAFGRYSHRFPLLADVYFLKLLYRSGIVAFLESPLVAGTFSTGGLTSCNELQILAENWQIQTLTEPHPFLQILLLFGKIIVKLRKLRSDYRHRRYDARKPKQSFLA